MSEILGRHELTEQLEGDDLSVLWRARQLGTGQPRIVEVVQPNVVAQSGVAEAFLDAVGTVARLGPRPHLQRVHEAGRDAATGQVYAISDLDAGSTVATQIGSAGPLHSVQIAHLIEQLALAVGALHEQHRCHGQLHPRHLLLVPDAGAGQRLVLRGLGRGAILELVPEAVRLQVHPYAAPEQLGWTPSGATSATDVWSLGLVALTLLTGAAPAAFWDARSTTELAQRIAHHPPLRPSGVSLDWAQRLPFGFDDWFAQCVCADPGQRHARFAEAARQLAALLGSSAPGERGAAYQVGAGFPAPHERGAARQVGAEEPPADRPDGFPVPIPFAGGGDGLESGHGGGGPRRGNNRTATYVVLGALGAVLVMLLVVVVVAGVGAWWYMAARDSDDVEVETGSDSSEVGVCPEEHAAAVIPVTASDPSWGDPLAPVTIVQFADLQCPFCARAEPTIKQLEHDYGPAKLRVVWKHFPMPFHKDAAPAQEASVAVFHAGGGGSAGSQAFFAFCDLAFANQRSLQPDNFADWASKSGVPVASFRTELGKSRNREKIAEDTALARKIGAKGTPSFHINGVQLGGAQPAAKFSAIIDAELKEAQELVDSGTSRPLVYVRRVAANWGVQPSPKPSSQPNSDDTIWNVPVLPDDPKKGPADALVTIVEWSDFQCPYCKRVNPTLEQLLAKYPDDVRLVWKDNPLTFHARAKPAAMLARFAFDQQGSEGFWKAHEALFASQGELEDANLASLCARLGLNWPAVQRGLARGPQLDKIAASVELANALDARGVPQFFINGYRLKGAQPLAKFDEIVQARLAVARRLLASGTPRSEIYAATMRTARGPGSLETRTVAAPSPASPYRGAANAPVVIQIFGDFQCPFCKRVLPTIEQIEREYPGQVKIVWRNLPLAFHKDAALAAEAAHEAFAQRGSAGFWRFHDRLFAVQSESGALERAGLERIAAEQGLDLNRFQRALDARRHRAHVEADRNAAQGAGISGTPSFLVNRYFIAGAQPLNTFKQRVDAALSDAR